MASRLTWLLVAGLVAGIVAGVVVFAAFRSGSAAGRGPLSNLHADPLGFSMAVNVDQSGSVSGPFVVNNTGVRPLILDRVTLVGLQDGLRLRGAYIVPYPQHPTGPRPRSATIGIVPGYGLSPEDRGIQGATVPPHAQIAIVLGVKPTKAGRHAWFAVNITYHDGAHTYTLRTPLAARICAPKAPYVGDNSHDCSPPGPLKRH